MGSLKGKTFEKTLILSKPTDVALRMCMCHLSELGMMLSCSWYKFFYWQTRTFLAILWYSLKLHAASIKQCCDIVSHASRRGWRARLAVTLQLKSMVKSFAIVHS